MTPEKETNDSRAKRQRTAPPMQAAVHNLSADLWCDIADFLPKTSRALLAVALTAHPASFRESGWKGQPNAVSKAIISSKRADYSFDTILDELCEEARGETDANGQRPSLKRYMHSTSYSTDEYDLRFRESLSDQLMKYYNCAWEVMDFVDIPVSLASRLTDDDLGAVLVCIGAINNLKRLKLTHCFNVVGHGLEPLKISNALEKLDLGLYRDFESPFWRVHSREVRSLHFREVKLSEGPVCDIIDSILRREGGSSLRRLQYPFEWCNDFVVQKEGSFETIMNDNMDQIIRSGRMIEFVGHNTAALNTISCSVYFGFVSNAEFCSSIHDVWETDLVDHCMSCNERSFEVCIHCNQILCDADCSNDSINCTVCKITSCPRCQADASVADVVTYCDSDYCELFCPECRLSSCRNGDNDCNDCKIMVFDTLAEECNEKQARIDSLLEECRVQQAQIESQQEEMERSRSKH
eukprot:scaffold20552_cov161-Skeletonema_dohrnii-CCMP3373.AAC.8